MAELSSTKIYGNLTVNENITSNGHKVLLENDVYIKKGTGHYNSILSDNSISIGDYSVTEGYENRVQASGCHVEGKSSQVNANYCHVEGHGNVCIENDLCCRVGYKGSDITKITLGTYQITKKEEDFFNSLKVGDRVNFLTIVDGINKIYTILSATINNIVMNGANIDYMTYTLDEGQTDSRSKFICFKDKASTESLIQGSHVEGFANVCGGIGSHMEGIYNYSIGDYSHIEGFNNQTFGQYSHAEGYANSASGEGSHAEGFEGSAIGSYSHSECQGCVARGNASHAEGMYSEANGEVSHAEGQDCYAEGDYSHAEGGNCITNGNFSHAEGSSTETNGDYSHAEGYHTQSNGIYSHASGCRTVAQGYCQTVIGQCNVPQGTPTLNAGTDYVFIVGSGVPNGVKKNAMTLTWDGTLNVAKGITVAGQPLTGAAPIYRTEVNVKIGYTGHGESYSYNGKGFVTVKAENTKTDTAIYIDGIAEPANGAGYFIGPNENTFYFTKSVTVTHINYDDAIVTINVQTN